MKLTFFLFLLLFSTLKAETNIYSISMSGFPIGKCTDVWSEYTDSEGQCIKKLKTTSQMDIKRGNVNFSVSSHTILGVLCDTFEPVFIKTETNQLGSKLTAKGFAKNSSFFYEISKNSNIESDSFPLDKSITFLTMILKKHSSKEIVKGFKAKVISEDSLTVKNVSVSGKMNNDGTVTATIIYGGIPIEYVVKDHLVVSSSIKNGLITYSLDGYRFAKTAQQKKKKKVDIIKTSSFKNKGLSIKRPRKTIKVTFDVKGSNIPEIVSNCYQSVKRSTGKKSVTIDSGKTPCLAKKPTEKDTTANIYEDSNSPEIIKAAKKIAKGINSNEQKVYKTVLFVYSHIKNKNYKHGNLSASEVLEKRSGDCTEHSTLLAALLKAMKIPVRMAYGLVLDNNGTFFFHNWNEVYTKKGWFAVDSTFNQMKTDSSRIVIAYGGNTSASREETAFAVIRFLNSVEIFVNGYIYE